MIVAVAATAMQEAVLPRQGDETIICESDGARASTANCAGASASAEQLTCMWAMLWG